MSTASCSSRPLSRLAKSFACSEAVVYWFRERCRDFTPMLQPSVMRSATEKFMSDMLPKLSRLRETLDEFGLDCLTEVDGGINPLTASLAAAAGAQVLVAGSDVFKAEDRKARIAQLRGAEH